MASFVTLRWEDEEGVLPPVEHAQKLYGEGRLCWAAVAKSFDAKKVELWANGCWMVPPVFGRDEPTKAGMTVDTFAPGAKLLVKVHEDTLGAGVLEAFRELLPAIPAAELEDTLQQVLLHNKIFAQAAKSGLITKDFARYFLDEVCATLSTSTIRAITDRQGYVFGDQVGSHGQARSVLYYVFKEVSVFCGKVYHNKDRGAAQHELHVSAAVHDNLECPTLIKVMEYFEAGSHSILILPLLAKSLANLRASLVILPSDAICARIAAAVLAAMAGLAMAGWCHGDIKPQNIMLGKKKGRPVLVDLGSCAKVHDPLTELTPTFGLGLPEVAGLRWDLACLASTLYLLSCPLDADTPLPDTIEELHLQLSCMDAESLSLGHRTALRICEVYQQVGDVQQLRELVWAALMQDIQTSLGIDTAEFEGWWPTRRTSAGA